MMYRLITASLALLCIALQLLADPVGYTPTGRTLMKIDAATATQMQILARGNYQVTRVVDEAVELWLNQAELEKLNRQGIHPYAIPDLAYEMFLHLEATSRDNGDWRDYHNYNQLTTYLEGLHDAYPDLTDLFSIGQSVQGRELWVIRITDNPTVEEDEPEFKYISTMHGNEPVGTENLLALCDLLLTGYGVDPRYTAIVDNIDLYFLPMMNPDGNSSGVRQNANGVDLNRDFPDQYADPFNTPEGREQETAAVMEWTAGRNFVLSANFHTGALVVNYPFDSNPEGTNTYSPTPDEDLFVDMSEAYSIHNQPMWNGDWYHGITNGADWYCVYGGMQDWNYVWEGGMEVCIELSDTFWPDASLLPQLWDDNRESMLAYIEYCLEGIRGIVTDADTGQPLEATVLIDDNPHESYSDPEVGDYHRVCLPGTHTLTVSRQFYETAEIPGVFVNSGIATVVDVELVPLPATPDLQLVATLVDDGGDGVLDPGETAWLTVELANEGNQAAEGTVGILSGSSIEMTIVDDSGSWGTIDPMTAAWNYGNPFQLSVDAGCPLGEELPLELALSAGTYDTTINFSLVVGLQIEDFESGDFAAMPWEMGGNSDWTISETAWEGSHAARSGSITHNRTSSLNLTAEVVSPGEMSFRYKVSSEADYDYLRFYIDGDEQASWAGEVDWAEYSVTVAPGTHSFSWEYDKDGSVSEGGDCGWVDYIVFPPLAALPCPDITVTPDGFDVILEPGESTLELLNIDNSGSGVLEYTVQVDLAGEQTDVPFLELPKGGTDPRTDGNSRDQGGPDMFGHFWIDSDEPGGPVYDWVEINGFGSTPGDEDDGNYGPFPLGFTFDFYGWAYDEIRICTNGFLTLTSTDDAYSNQGIPNSAEPNGVIAPFWDDLNPSSDGTIYYYADPQHQRFIVEWDGVVRYGSSDPQTFQVVINADGTILYCYHTVTDGSSCTVGIENQDGSDGLQIVFNSEYLHDGLAILIDRDEPWLTVNPPGGTVDPSDFIQLDVMFDATDLAEDIYNGTITIVSNDQDEGEVILPVTMEVGMVVPDPVDDLQLYHGGGQVQLFWSAVPGATLYHIYECDTPYGTYSEIGTTAGTDYTVVLSEGKYYQVTADNR